MALKLGRISSLYIAFDTNPSAVYHQLGKAVDLTFNLNAQEVETTNHDSAGYREYLAGYIDGTVEATVRYDEADTAQMALVDTFNRAGFDAGTIVTTWDPLADFPTVLLKVSFDTTSGAPTVGTDFYVFSALITSMSLDSANEDVDNMSFTFRLTGAPTSFRATA